MTDHKFFPKKLEHVDLIETKPAQYLSIVRLYASQATVNVK